MTPTLGTMYFIVVKYDVKPESVDQWPEIVREFTEATLAEEGNLFFEWSKSLENDNQYVLVEGFTDEGAEPHVTSDHFAKAVSYTHLTLPTTPYV